MWFLISKILHIRPLQPTRPPMIQLFAHFQVFSFVKYFRTDWDKRRNVKGHRLGLNPRYWVQNFNIQYFNILLWMGKIVIYLGTVNLGLMTHRQSGRGLVAKDWDMYTREQWGEWRTCEWWGWAGENNQDWLEEVVWHDSRVRTWTKNKPEWKKLTP